MKIVRKILLTCVAIAVCAFLDQYFHVYHTAWLWLSAGTVFGIWKGDYGFILYGAVVGMSYELYVRHGYALLWVPALILIVAVAITVRKMKTTEQVASGSANSASADLSDEQYYAQASEEFDSGNIQRGLFTKAEVEAGGDEKQTRLLYIQYRVGQLLAENANPRRPSDLETESGADIANETHESISTNRHKFVGGLIILLVALVVIFIIHPQGMPTQQGEVWVADLGDGVYMEFVPIPAGSFMMGSENGNTDEMPVHKVTLTKPFWLAKTEVTQEQYSQIMGENPSLFKGDQNPVENVSWHYAMEFCRKLTEQERQAGHLPMGYEYTLPTEAQWEYACRAGTSDDYMCNLDARVGYSDGYEKTFPVGQRQANAWGLFDMHGNVWEWCCDWFGDYASGGASDPSGASTGPDRVVRGGTLYYSGEGCASAKRSMTNPGVDHGGLGFRVCLSVK